MGEGSGCDSWVATLTISIQSDPCSKISKAKDNAGQKAADILEQAVDKMRSKKGVNAYSGRSKNGPKQTISKAQKTQAKMAAA